jgi:type I restriction enzyme M protein
MHLTTALEAQGRTSRNFWDLFLQNLNRYDDALIGDWLQIALGSDVSVKDFPSWFSTQLDDVGLTGHFGTPPSIADLISSLLDYREISTILDPACGTGGLLQAVIQRSGEHALTYGLESDNEAAAWAVLRFIVCGFHNVIVKARDAFMDQTRSSATEPTTFDAVVLNPPFGKVFDARSVSELIKQWGNEVWSRNSRVSSESAYVHLAFQRLSARGTAAIVVPLGFLVRGAADERLREQLIKENAIDGVIGLPGRLFGPGATIDAAILVLCKRNQNSVKKAVFFIDARELAQRQANRWVLTNETVSSLTKIFNEHQAIPGLSELVPEEELASQSFSLSPARYVMQVSADLRADPLERRKRIDALDEHYAALREEYEALRIELSGMNSG